MTSVPANETTGPLPHLCFSSRIRVGNQLLELISVTSLIIEPNSECQPSSTSIEISVVATGDFRLRFVGTVQQ